MIETMEKWIMRIICLLAFAAFMVVGCSYINRKLSLDDDNFLEEFLEEQFEDHTGLDLDFTPDTREV